MVLEGSSRATGTVWNRRVVAIGQAGLKVDTAAIRVRIVADGAFAADGKYVEAAVKALRRVTGRRIVFGDGGWLFWLSDRPVAGEGYERVWCYAQGAVIPVDTRMEGVQLTKEIAVVPAGASVWTDGYGRGVLQREGKVFRFFSRLDPNWGDLVWSSRLPVLLEGLMIRNEDAGVWDRRVLDVAQIRPAKRVGVHREAEVGHAPKTEGRDRSDGRERVDLRPALWVLALLIFLMERIIANQYGKA